jgi:uncharacterized protein (TIGR03000 family)
MADGPIAWRILIGAPPGPCYRESAENGQLYPPGYSPGYGYYRDYKDQPSIVITNQPPPPPVPAMPVARTLASLLGVPETAALFQVRVPPDAEVWFSGEKTVKQGGFRTYVTPVLPADRAVTYEVRARWSQDGKVVDRTQPVTFHSGDRVTVDFLSRAAPAAEVTPLPPPRKLVGP